jgi:hypothetical protein
MVWICNMSSLFFSDDIDDRLVSAYLDDDFNNTRHGNWESLIASD